MHPRYRTPHLAIVALTVWSAILALSGSYEQLFTYVMFASILFSVADRGRGLQTAPRSAGAPAPVPDARLPGGSFIFIAGSAAFVINTLFQRPVESLIGISLLLLGLPALLVLAEGVYCGIGHCKKGVSFA